MVSITKTRALIEKADRYGAHHYLPLPIVLTRGEGSYVWDVDGKRYIDFLSAYSAVNFGHAHPELIATLTTQASRLSVCSRAFHSEQLSLFSEELATFCDLERVLPMNSGAEAVETAIKIARKWGYEKKGVKAGKAEIIAMKNNFHGRTLSLISFSTEAKYRHHFEPFTPGFKIVDFADTAAVKAAITKNTVGVLLEPIQAEAGIWVPSKGHLSQLREICAAENVLLLLDEIQTGLGRTGKMFCYEYENIKPDLLIIGKSLGGGLLPISAVVTKNEVMEVIRPGDHGSTFGGNPLACAVARKSLEIIKRDKLSDRAKKIGEIIRQKLLDTPLPNIKEIRGMGALIGVDIHSKYGAARIYCEKLSQAGVLCKETHDTVIRIAPPLTIPEKVLAEGMDILIKCLQS